MRGVRGVRQEIDAHTHDHRMARARRPGGGAAPRRERRTVGRRSVWEDDERLFGREGVGWQGGERRRAVYITGGVRQEIDAHTHDDHRMARARQQRWGVRQHDVKRGRRG